MRPIPIPALLYGAIFSAVTDANVKTRSTSLQVQPEIIQPICELFDAYAAANGYANLQIYSTLDGTLDSTSIYTNILPDRSTGYGFDIGLITSTGEVVPYITKCNEWMVANSWQYGFVLRYPRRQDRYHRNCLCTAPFPVCGKKSTLRSCTRTTSRWRNISIISRTIR